MSAIFGKINYSTTTNITEQCNTMLNGYQKCVFDRSHTESFSNGFMGCVQLFVQETDSQDTLPFMAEHYYITFDGMIDNRNELCNLLKVPSDTPNGQLIFHAYKKWHTDMLNYLEGIYTIAIYDTQSETLFLANDRTSSRCLYYYVSDAECIFSTLLRPILSVQTHPSSLNEDYLTDYAILPGLMPTLTGHETPYENIYKFEPATYLLIKKGSIIEKKHYWHPVPNAHSYQKKECGKAFMDTFQHCVSKAIDTPYDVAIAMSSGLDSASIGALAATQLRKHNRPLYTYTYVPATDDVAKTHAYDVVNEKEDVLKIAAMHPNMIPHFITNDGKDCFEELDVLLEELEIPFKAFVNLPILRYLYRSARQKGCRVVLNGQCGNSTISFGKPDDILYHLYRTRKLFSLLINQWLYCKRSKIPFLKDTKALIHYFRKVNHDKVRASQLDSLIEPPYFSAHLIEKYGKKERFLQNNMITNECYMPAKEDYLDISYSISALTYIGESETKLGLYTGVMIRDVSRDPAIIQFCNDIPYDAYMQEGLPRWLIRGNFGSYLPKEITHNLWRYGLQNGDWVTRLVPNWTKYHREMTHLFDSDICKDYIDHEKVAAFLQNNQCLDPNDTALEGQLLMISFAYIFTKYLNLSQQK